jgi:hypothetical protein
MRGGSRNAAARIGAGNLAAGTTQLELGRINLIVSLNQHEVRASAAFALQTHRRGLKQVLWGVARRAS